MKPSLRAVLFDGSKIGQVHRSMDSSLVTIFAKVEIYNANIYKYLRYVWRKLRGENVEKSLKIVGKERKEFWKLKYWEENDDKISK